MKTGKVTKSNLIAISEINNSLIHSLPHKDASLINFDFSRTNYQTEIQTKCTQTEMHTNKKKQTEMYSNRNTVEAAYCNRFGGSN